jgi:hypothetical protein
MMTTVFSIAPQVHHKSSLVCQLQDITPDDAIERLQKLGVLAVEGQLPNSIVLVGFNWEVSKLVWDLDRYGYPRNTARIFGKLSKRLAS